MNTKEETLVVAQFLEWAVAAHQKHYSTSAGASVPQEETNVSVRTDDELSLEARQKQIRQLFARNEW